MNTSPSRKRLRLPEATSAVTSTVVPSRKPGAFRFNELPPELQLMIVSFALAPQGVTYIRRKENDGHFPFHVFSDQNGERYPLDGLLKVSRGFGVMFRSIFIESILNSDSFRFEDTVACWNFTAKMNIRSYQRLDFHAEFLDRRTTTLNMLTRWPVIPGPLANLRQVDLHFFGLYPPGKNTTPQTLQIMKAVPFVRSASTIMASLVGKLEQLELIKAHVEFFQAGTCLGGSHEVMTCNLLKRFNDAIKGSVAEIVLRRSKWDEFSKRDVRFECTSKQESIVLGQDQIPMSRPGKWYQAG